MPRPKKAAVATSCAECGATFATTRSNARFCTKEHRVAFARRSEKEGALVIAFVKAWIAGKGGGHRGSHPVVGPCMTEITSIVRDLLERDREAGRPSPIGYAESLLAESKYIDRKPKRPRRRAEQPRPVE